MAFVVSVLANQGGAYTKTSKAAALAEEAYFSTHDKPDDYTSPLPSQMDVLSADRVREIEKTEAALEEAKIEKIDHATTTVANWNLQKEKALRQAKSIEAEAALVEKYAGRDYTRNMTAIYNRQASELFSLQNLSHQNRATQGALTQRTSMSGLKNTGSSARVSDQQKALASAQETLAKSGIETGREATVGATQDTLEQILSRSSLARKDAALLRSDFAGTISADAEGNLSYSGTQSAYADLFMAQGTAAEHKLDYNVGVLTEQYSQLQSDFNWNVAGDFLNMAVDIAGIFI
jgi:hypothetical protein